MSQLVASNNWQQDRHHGRRTTLASLRLTQNPAGFSRQWMQSCTVRGNRPRGRPVRVRRGCACGRGPARPDRSARPRLMRCIRLITTSRAMGLTGCAAISCPSAGRAMPTAVPNHRLDPRLPGAVMHEPTASERHVDVRQGDLVSRVREQIPVQHHEVRGLADLDRKSTRLNSSHDQISYAVFCLKKKKKYGNGRIRTTNKKNILLLDIHERNF